VTYLKKNGVNKKVNIKIFLELKCTEKKNSNNSRIKFYLYRLVGLEIINEEGGGEGDPGNLVFFVVILNEIIK